MLESSPHYIAIMQSGNSCLAWHATQQIICLFMILLMAKWFKVVMKLLIFHGSLRIFVLTKSLTTLFIYKQILLPGNISFLSDFFPWLKNGNPGKSWNVTPLQASYHIFCLGFYFWILLLKFKCWPFVGNPFSATHLRFQVLVLPGHYLEFSLEFIQ